MTTTEIPKFTIHYFKSKVIDIKPLEAAYERSSDDIANDYNPFQLKSLQNYNPIYGQFFSLNASNFNSISFNQRYQIQDMMNVINQENREPAEKPVFIKYSPLIDPIRYMIGKYKTAAESVLILPTLDCMDSHSACHTKLLDSNNASYVDNFFSFLSSKLLHGHQFLNSIDYYGSFLGIQNKFKVNVIDDLDYLNESDYFKDNFNKLFTILRTDSESDEFMNFGSRTNKQRLVISNTPKHNITMEEILVLQEENELINESNNCSDVVYEKNISKSSSGGSTNSSNNSEANYSTDNDEDGNNDSDNDNDSDSDSDIDSVSDNCEDGDDDSGDDDSESTFSQEPAVFAYINKFPVQLICLEKCDGTIDELFEKDKLSCEEAGSALIQIIMILITYQKCFHFTHNDLHTNNIMYVNTDLEYLFYKYNNTTYKVPTYGKIYKLIDFGRSIYRFHGKLFCSDSFAAGGDAATQYNCEPYMNENKPRLEPNFSFDLCRLGSSIYDFIIDDDDDEGDFDDLQKTIARWCTDDNGKNVLYKKNGDERYPGFKLYKMIARGVHRHTPQEQLDYPYFSQYALTNKKAKKIDMDLVFDIDTLPAYV